jgi:hypothetical protein
MSRFAALVNTESMCSGRYSFEPLGFARGRPAPPGALERARSALFLRSVSYDIRHMMPPGWGCPNGGGGWSTPCHWTLTITHRHCIFFRLSVIPVTIPLSLCAMFTWGTWVTPTPTTTQPGRSRSSLSRLFRMTDVMSWWVGAGRRCSMGLGARRGGPGLGRGLAGRWGGGMGGFGGGLVWPGVAGLTGRLEPW